MPICTAAPSTVVNSPQLVPAGRVGCKQQGKSSVGRVRYRFNKFVAKKGQVQSVKLGPVKNVKLEPVEYSMQFPFVETRKPVMHSTQRQSSAFTCAAALNARCAAEQTQTVTRQAPTMTHIPAKEKLPDLDDGGTGFPPRDDGDGGGGGGGGGGNWSGGFFFFGFLLFLGFLKDKESEGPYRDDRRR